MLVFRWALWAATIICWVFGLTGIAIIFSAFRRWVVGERPPTAFELPD